MRLALSHNNLKVIIWPGGSVTAPKASKGVPGQKGFKEFTSQEYDPRTNKTRAMGFCVEVFKAALEDLLYEVPIEYIPFVDAIDEMKGNHNDLLYQIYLQGKSCQVICPER